MMIKNTENNNFLSSVEELRERARQKMEQGALTPSYGLDVKKSVEILNEALATEMICVMRYLNHYFMAEGISSESVKEEFKEHATEEQGHAELLAARIRQLNGKPDFHPGRMLARSHAEFKVGETLVDMIEEDLYAERVAIESYREMIAYFGEKDPTTRRMLEEILAKEEEHAEDMSGLLITMDPTKKEDAAPGLTRFEKTSLSERRA